MFKSARLKLTAWYLMIIMAISLLFSLVIYTGINRELNRIERFHKLRQQEERQEFFPSFEQFRRERQKLGFPVPPRLTPYDPQMVAQSRMRLMLRLILVNLGILLIAGVSGYILAGRTLYPIELMVEKQYQFIADASHEIRTPLTSLRTALEVDLRDKSQTSKTKELLLKYLEDVKSLQLLSDRLLQLASYEKDHGRVFLTSVSLSEIIENSLRMLAGQIEKKKIQIVQKLKQEVVLGDKKSLIDLLTIILDNAVKYSKIGGKIILLAKKTADKVEIEVEDFGIGISKKDLPHIFDRFFRADSARSKSELGGYGLGLAIAKKIVEAHNGTISVESELKKGTKVSIKLPSGS